MRQRWQATEARRRGLLDEVLRKALRCVMGDVGAELWKGGMVRPAERGGLENVTFSSSMVTPTGKGDGVLRRRCEAPTFSIHLVILRGCDS